ncbi:beta-propeller fold lactonase family protein [Klebsiella pneumoniae]|uniref:beta-propeller fold lactonase family protein n=1 Tax=Klebsiella pneumoniae TaxID=573 RepID=UPI003918D18D
MPQGRVQPMVVSPNKKRFLYVGVRPEFRVLAYRITPDNRALTFAGEAALPGSPTHISTDHHSRCLQRLLQSGLCQRDPAARWPAGGNHHRGGRAGRRHSANISPDNRTLWVPALKQDRICLFTLSDIGFLSARGPPGSDDRHESAGPRHIVFHPSQQYGYCVNEPKRNGRCGVLWELKDPKGNIECVQTLDMMPPDFSGVRWADVHITPDGRHLYACDRTASTTVFSVSEDGSVLAVEEDSLPRPSRAALTPITAVNISLPPGRKSHHIAVCTTSSVSRDCRRRKAAMRRAGADVGGGRQRSLNCHQVKEKTSP